MKHALPVLRLPLLNSGILGSWNKFRWTLCSLLFLCLPVAAAAGVLNALHGSGGRFLVAMILLAAIAVDMAAAVIFLHHARYVATLFACHGIMERVAKRAGSEPGRKLT